MDIKVEQLRTGVSDSIFRVQHELGTFSLRLWIIVGGTPALSFLDYSFSQRYGSENAGLWTSDNFDNELRRYKHQAAGTYKNPAQGPTFDVLPNGLDDVDAYLRKYVPLKALREYRMDLLPFDYDLESKRVHDKENREYVVLHIDAGSYYVPVVTMQSGSAAGRVGEGEARLFSEAWRNYAEFANYGEGYLGLTAYEDLTEEQYEKMRNLLVAVYLERKSEIEKAALAADRKLKKLKGER